MYVAFSGLAETYRTVNFLWLFFSCKLLKYQTFHSSNNVSKINRKSCKTCWSVARKRKTRGITLGAFIYDAALPKHEDKVPIYAVAESRSTNAWEVADITSVSRIELYSPQIVKSTVTNAEKNSTVCSRKPRGNATYMEVLTSPFYHNCNILLI